MNQVFWKEIVGKGSQKAFFEREFTKEEMETFTSLDLSWYEQKCLLRHKNCPLYYAIKVTQSPIWYERLTGYLAKPNREFLCMKGFEDPKSTVRASCYKTALNYKYPENPIEVCKKIISDKRVHGYFYGSSWSIEGLEKVVNGEMSFEDWFENGYEKQNLKTS